MIKFDTRDKKPKIYNIAVLTVLTAAVVLAEILKIRVAGERAIAINITVIVYVSAVILMLAAAFLKQLQYNPYSYNTVYYVGFAIFAVSVLVTHILLQIRITENIDVYDSYQSLFYLMRSAERYMILSIPFILVFSLGLIISNISLIRHEGLKTVNVLGIILSFLLVAGEVFLLKYDYYVTGSEREIMFHDLFGNTFAAIYLYFECMMIGTIVADIIAARHRPEYNKDFVIILGCGLRKDGTPTPLLRSRIDRAVTFYREQKEKTGKELVFIASGGKGEDEAVAESTAIKQYLIEQGIPENLIEEENRSTDTAENMRFSKEIIEKINLDGKIAFSTTNYHVFRSGLFARREKMRAVGMGAPTKWYFWPNAAVREFVGLLTKHRLKQAIILSSILAFYIIMTLLIYD